MVFITIYTYYLYSLEHTLSLNVSFPVTTFSLWNATNNFFWTNPIQNSTSSIFLFGKTFLPKWNRKSSSNPASIAKWCNLSTVTRLHDKSRSSTKTSSMDSVNKPQAIRPDPNFLTAVQQLIARITPATPLKQKFYQG